MTKGLGATFAREGAANIFVEGLNMTFGTTTGTKIGTATNEKIGFYNATPVVQPAGITDVATSTVDATYGAEEANVINHMRTRVNGLITRLESIGIIGTI